MPVSSTRKGGVCLLEISNPPHGILSSAGAKELSAAIDAALADSLSRVVVLTGGDPGIFIRHFDLRSIRKAANALSSNLIGPEAFIDAEFARLTDRIADSELPFIAAINGICMGAGLELALACDLRIAQSDVAHIGLPEIRVDLLPGGGGTIRLARLIGEAAALDMALRGRTVTAERAWQLGIVGDLVDDASRCALQIASALAERDPNALSAIKRLVRSAHEEPLQAGLHAERMAFATQIGASEQAKARMDSLLASGRMLETIPACDGESTRN